MKKVNYYIKISLCLFISFIFIESIFKFITFKNIFDMSYLRIIIFSLGSSALLGFLISFFKEKVSKVLILVIVLFSGVYAIAEMGFYNFMGNYMSFNAAGDGAGRVLEYVAEFIRYIKPEYYLCLIPFFILLLIFIFKKASFIDQLVI